MYFSFLNVLYLNFSIKTCIVMMDIFISKILGQKMTWTEKTFFLKIEGLYNYPKFTNVSYMNYLCLYLDIII